MPWLQAARGRLSRIGSSCVGEVSHFEVEFASPIDFERGSNARYSLSDSLFITITGIIAGASSLLKVVSVWSDQVLRQISGWISVPDDSTL